MKYNYQYSRTRRWRKFQKVKDIYNSEEHVRIESFVTTLIPFFSDDANKVGICWLCRSGQLHVTPSSRLFLRTKQYPILLRTSKIWKGLPQYYSVLQNTTPVLLCTTKDYSTAIKYSSSSTSYYKVLVQYYFVLQSTTLVLLRATKYYSSTLKHYSSNTTIIPY